jgi:hypothetical protein
VVNCSAEFLLWQLPFAPDCACAYCTAPSSIPPPPPPRPWSGPGEKSTTIYCHPLCVLADRCGWQLWVAALKLDHTVPGGFPALFLGDAAAPPRCAQALAGCWPVKTEATRCRQCEGTQQHHLKEAGCTKGDIQQYCGGGGAPTGTPIPPFWLNREYA